MGKIIFSIIMLIIIAVCLVISLRESIIHGVNDKLRAFYVLAICLASMLFGVIFTGLLFNL